MAKYVDLVPGGGIEPPLCHQNWILNPARLPVPPSRHESEGDAVYGNLLRRKIPLLQFNQSSMLLFAIMKTADFDFKLPPELIAQYPTEQRGDSRLLCLDRANGNISDHQFSDLTQLLMPEDLLVFNNTKVIPARLYGKKSSGGKVELLIERVLSETTALAHIKASKSPKSGTEIILDDNTKLLVTGRRNELFYIESLMPLMPILDSLGHLPLPPYIERPDEISDQSRYQTIYAKHEGAVAAPTAGLHFTDEILLELTNKKIDFAYVTLHVGAGTFQPVRVDDVTNHTMHSERYELDTVNSEKISQAKNAGRRIIAVGTTSVRVLETIAKNKEILASQGETDIFIYPGFEYKLVDALITNFHLPQSTLLMLVSAFSSKQNILNAYNHAIKQGYRFFSYGDAMLIS